MLGLHLVTGGVSLSWFWGAFVMIIPFCCDSCCESASAAFRLQSLFSLLCRADVVRGGVGAGGGPTIEMQPASLPAPAQGVVVAQGGMQATLLSGT